MVGIMLVAVAAEQSLLQGQVVLAAQAAAEMGVSAPQSIRQMGRPIPAAVAVGLVRLPGLLAAPAS